MIGRNLRALAKYRSYLEWHFFRTSRTGLVIQELAAVPIYDSTRGLVKGYPRTPGAGQLSAAGRSAHIGDSRHELHRRPDGILVCVSDLWRTAGKASERFAAQALDYDRYRPRYPDDVFDDLVESVGLTRGTRWSR